MAPPAADPPSGDALERWLAEVRTDQAARSRARLGALRAHAAEDATVIGVLADLGERRSPVLVTTTHGRRHRVEVRAVGPDAVVLAAGRDEWLVTRLACIAAVRLVGGDPVHGGSWPAPPSRVTASAWRSAGRCWPERSSRSAPRWRCYASSRTT
jgi:hypothetical protein